MLIGSFKIIEILKLFQTTNTNSKFMYTKLQGTYKLSEMDWSGTDTFKI
jgi:hypothetical protein